MEINFLEYRVRNSDTLKTVASRLGMTGEELKLFHNAHCQKMDKIWFDNLNGVQYIIVPIDFKTEKQKEEEKKNTLPPTQLPDSFFAKTYAVHETFESPFEAPVNIDYTIDLNVRKDKNKNHHVLSYRQKDFKSNGNIPDDKVSSLSIACMASIMPLDFILGSHGRITGFEDHKKITETFITQRKELEDFFTGEITRSYMDTFEKNIAEEQFFLQQFQSTLLFQTVFPTMDWFHKKSSWTESFYFLQNSFPVQCQMEIQQENKDNDFMVTVIRGNIAEHYSLQELITGIKHNEISEESVLGEFIIEYITHKKNKNLIQACSSVMLWREKTLIQKHNITINTRII